MMISKKHIMYIVLLLLNTPEFLYHGAFKIGINVSEVYIGVYSFLIFILVLNIKRITRNQILLCILLTFYGFFQVVNSIVSGGLIENALVVHISMFIPVLIYIYMYKKSTYDIGLCIKALVVIGMLYFILVDTLSIAIMHKSQHVILSNILPIFLLAVISLSLYEENVKWIWLVLGAYCVWIILSLSLFTSDMRFQVKAIILTVGIFISYIVYVKFISKLKGVPTPPYVILFIIFLFFLGVSLQYITLNSFHGRETSLGLRLLVTKEQISEILSGNVFNYIFGYGYGTSMKQYPIIFGGSKHLLKSHSGIISLIYEQGLFIILAILCFLIFMLNIKPTSGYVSRDIREKHRGAQFILFVFICTWILLNVIYLISVPVPNYIHQSQMVLSTLIILYLSKSINRA